MALALCLAAASAGLAGAGCRVNEDDVRRWESTARGPEKLTAVLLHDKYYLQRREAIVYKFWQDDLMSLILRSMVRGHRESFVQRRTEKGPGPVQRLLQEIKAIYFEIHRDIIKNT